MVHPVEQKYIGVIGSAANVPDEIFKMAEEVGRLIAVAGCITVTGGGTGIWRQLAEGLSKQVGW